MPARGHHVQVRSDSLGSVVCFTGLAHFQCLPVDTTFRCAAIHRLCGAFRWPDRLPVPACGHYFQVHRALSDFQGCIAGFRMTLLSYQGHSFAWQSVWLIQHTSSPPRALLPQREETKYERLVEWGCSCFPDSCAKCKHPHPTQRWVCNLRMLLC